MGETPLRTCREALRQRIQAGLLLADAFSFFGPCYDLSNEAAFDELLDVLNGHSLRDQESSEDAEPSEEIFTYSRRRFEGHRLAVKARDQARLALAALDDIHSTLESFHRTIKWSPPLLEELFHVDLSEPRSFFIPGEIDILSTFFEGFDWDEAAHRLERLVDLPLRPKLSRGPMKNTTLQRSLAVCREYWRDVEGRSWSMSSLKVKAVRDQNDPLLLQGACEAFVSDVFNYLELRHGLHDLCSGWTAVEGAQPQVGP